MYPNLAKHLYSLRVGDLRSPEQPVVGAAQQRTSPRQSDKRPSDRETSGLQRPQARDER